jgi:hypothetical protein
MSTTAEPETLDPTDPPILLAGLIAARRTGDEMLEEVMQRGLEEHGIVVRFVCDLEAEVARE